jgi:hypothetical protein
LLYELDGNQETENGAGSEHCEDYGTNINSKF